MSKLLVPVILIVLVGLAYGSYAVLHAPVPKGPVRSAYWGTWRTSPAVTFTAPATYNGEPFTGWYYTCWGGDIGHTSREHIITIPHPRHDMMQGGYGLGAGAWAYYGSGGTTTVIEAQFPGSD